MASGDVSIVSRHHETSNALRTYLTAAGMGVRCTRELGGCATSSSAKTRAFVVFPDDFRREAVVAALAEMAEKRPRALVVLVTGHPQRFAELSDTRRVVIVLRPAWAWAILDAIRAST